LATPTIVLFGVMQTSSSAIIPSVSAFRKSPGLVPGFSTAVMPPFVAAGRGWLNVRNVQPLDRESSR
jgi:hypothetical protein